MNVSLLVGITVILLIMIYWINRPWRIM